MALSRAQLADPECPVSDDDYDAIEVMSAINSLHDSLQGKLEANVQNALAAQRRGPYQGEHHRHRRAARSAARITRRVAGCRAQSRSKSLRDPRHRRPLRIQVAFPGYAAFMTIRASALSCR
jgi:hypothetical protein